eukprot:scaffold7551_cov123-Isochrysis_galbana.AAC.3
MCEMRSWSDKTPTHSELPADEEEVQQHSRVLGGARLADERVDLDPDWPEDNDDRQEEEVLYAEHVPERPGGKLVHVKEHGVLRPELGRIKLRVGTPDARDNRVCEQMVLVVLVAPPL